MKQQTKTVLPANMADRLLDVREAAYFLALKPATLYKLAYEKKIPYVKLGKALRFRLSVLEKWVCDSEVKVRDQG